MDDGFADPQGQLKRLTTSTSTPPTPLKPDKIQSLYDEILHAVAAKDPSEALKARLRAILGTIATAQESPSLNLLAAFTLCSVNEAINVLSGLRSVLHIPKDPDEPILVIHPTFPEYLLAPSPTKPQLFDFGSADEHSASFIRCLEIMTSTEGPREGLRRNILELDRDSILKDEIPDLLGRIRNHISPPLKYACRYWSTHLSLAIGSCRTEAINDRLRLFLEHHALHWLESCAYLDLLEEAILALDSAHRSCQKYERAMRDLCPLLADIHRFTSTYVQCIRESPLDVYHSALVHAPQESLIKRVYNHSLRIQRSLQIDRGAPPSWSHCIGTLEGCTIAAILSMALSPDGRYLATLHPDRVKIWNLTTRTLFSDISLDERLDWYEGGSISYSHDNAYIAVAGFNKGIYILEVRTGRVAHTLDVRPTECSSAVYVASGSRFFAVLEGEVKLWDTSGWYCLLSLTKSSSHRRSTTSISPQGTVVAFCEGSSVRLLDLVSASHTPPLQLPGTNYHASVFSPNGGHLAVAAKNTISILAVERTGATLVRSIECSPSSLAFSPDGNQLAWGDEHGAIYAVPTDVNGTEDNTQVLSPKRRKKILVKNIAWSLDGSRVISAEEIYVPTQRRSSLASWILMYSVRIWDFSFAAQDMSPHPDDHLPSSLSALTPHFAVLYPLDAPDRLTLLHIASSVPVDAFAGICTHETGLMLRSCADMADVLDIVLEHAPTAPLLGARHWAYLTGHHHLQYNPHAVTSPNGELLAYADKDDRLWLHDLQLAKPLATFAFRAPRAECALAFSFDSTLLAFGWRQHPVQVYSLQTESLVVIDAIPGAEALAFSSNNGLLALGTSATIHILNWRTKQVIHSVKLKESPVGKVFDKIIFTLDDKYLLVQFTHLIYVMDTVSATIIYGTWSGETNIFHNLDFSSDDTGFLVHGTDGDVHQLKLWNPGERVWPVFSITKDGWVYAKSPGRKARLCWLPPEWCEIWTVSKGKFCAADWDQRKAVVFDVSRIPDYVENWGSDSE